MSSHPEESSTELRRRALASSHAHLVFADAEAKQTRDLTVRRLWKNSKEARHCPRDATMQWSDEVAVTNDPDILKYFLNSGRTLPTFPAAGDRERCFLDPCKVRVGIVNSGGPAPGLNVVNDSIVKRHFAFADDYAHAKGEEDELLIYGYLGGFSGLAGVYAERDGDNKRQLIPSHGLERRVAAEEPAYFVTDDHALAPVTFLKSSRFNLRDNIDRVADQVVRDQLDILYVVGGDGSLTGAQQIKSALEQRNPPYRPNGHEFIVIGAPKTMDNDVLFTDTTFGFTTTVDHLVDAIRTFHQTIECQDRVGVMQVFGAGSGYVALYAAYSSGEVDYVVLPELVEYEGLLATLGEKAHRCIDLARFIGIKKSLEQVDGPTLLNIYQEGFKRVLKQAKRRVVERVVKKRHSLVVVAEGALGPYEHGERTNLVMPFKDLVSELKKALTDAPRCGHGPDWLKEVKVTPIEPTYLIRDNPPRSYDIVLCKFIGKAMVDAALTGYTDCMVARWCGQYALIPLNLATALTSRVDPRDYFFRTMVEKYRRC